MNLAAACWAIYLGCTTPSRLAREWGISKGDASDLFHELLAKKRIRATAAGMEVVEAPEDPAPPKVVGTRYRVNYDASGRGQWRVRERGTGKHVRSFAWYEDATRFAVQVAS